MRKKLAFIEGDVFEAQVKDRYHYFQFVYNDKSYLGADLIRLFNYNINAPMNLLDFDLLISFGVKSYYYSMVKFGVKEEFWRRIGNNPIEENFDPPTFRTTAQTKSKEANDWKLIKGAKWTFIGELNSELLKLPVASMIPPSQLIEIMELGYDPFLKWVK